MALGFDPEHHESSQIETPRLGAAQATARLEAAFVRIAAAAVPPAGQDFAVPDPEDKAAADVVDREVLRGVATRLDEIIGRVRGLLSGPRDADTRSHPLTHAEPAHAERE